MEGMTAIKELSIEHDGASASLPLETKNNGDGDKKGTDPTITFLEAEVLRNNKTILDNEIKWPKALFACRTTMIRNRGEKHRRSWRCFGVM